MNDPLPHAAIGMVLGLLEHLREAPHGREDLYKLGGPLGYELDDLLPVTSAARALGLVVIHSGDIELTADGRVVAEAEEADRKDRLARAVGELPLVQRILQALRRAPHGRVPREDLREQLREHFSPGEAERQLSTALDWARYVELFDVDPDADEFLLPAAE
jgi:NitT/TauT family transport system ATP-binding protein